MHSCRVLVVSRAKKEVKDWINRISKWDFQTIIPAHMAAPLKAGPADLKFAYDFLYDGDEAKSPAATSKLAFSLPFFQPPPVPAKKENSVVFPERDLAVLNALDKIVSATGLAS